MKLKKLYADNKLNFQEGEYNCGPVTLLNILSLKGDETHTEDELSKLCKAKPITGTDEADMISAAKSLGLEVVEAKKDGTLAEIEKHIDDGHYVIVCYMHAFSGQGHYALISEYDDKAYYFRDCSLGFMRLKKKYFEKHWHSQVENIPRWFMAIK